MSRNLSSLGARKGVSDSLLQRLQREAREQGTLSPEAVSVLAREYLVGESTVLGVASAYDLLAPAHAGEKVHVCNGSACLGAGTQGPLTDTLSEHFGEKEIGAVTCLGRCHDGGAFRFEGENYSDKSAAEIDTILRGEADAAAAADRIPVRASRPLLTEPIPALEEFYGRLAALLSRKPEALLGEIQASRLRGRGGAGFPLGTKLAECRVHQAPGKYVVCNADEGDPGAYSDRYLLEERPHAVLFGMLAAGYIMGADRGVLYIRDEYPESHRAIETAIREAEALGYVGEGISGLDFNFQFEIVRGAGAYICGEETALLASIEGQRPQVRTRPPYPAEEGLFGAPTLVSNVETLACLPALFEIGGEAFAAIGTADSSGTKLVCLDSGFLRPGLLEVEMGTPLSDVVFELGGGFRRPTKALQVGGPLGGLVPVEKIGELRVEFASFSDAGFLLGHAGIVSIPESLPMVEYLEHLFDFCARESCGKCFPCRLGSVRGREIFAAARRGEGKIDRSLLEDLLETMEIGSLCGLGSGLPLPIRNAVTFFEAELRGSMEGRGGLEG